MKTFKAFVYETSFYYLLAIFWLPLVYAVTYHFSFMEMYSLEWFKVSLVLSPIILLFSGVRYLFSKRKLEKAKYTARN